MPSRASKRLSVAAGLLALGGLGVAASAAPGERAAREYVVVYEQGASRAAARAAVEQAGGRIVEENAAIGVATVRARGERFSARAAAEGALVGAAVNRPIGRAPESPQRALERPLDGREPFASASRSRKRSAPSVGEPLADRQWDMQMIGATYEGSYRRQQGSSGVRVGIMDTGIDATHPDLRANVNRSLSRNFTRDIPLVDGPCEEEPDQSCDDPATVDEDSHGTHVAGTVGAALNGFGIGGVAPRVELVNLRAGQDSGYFFLQPTVDALTYAGDNGIDVVNMSFYIDPYLYNCADNPADPPEAQAEQRTIIEATQRALRYARDRGVTLVGAAGNSATDLGRPEFDPTSPDFPPGNERPRYVDNSCLDLPTEGEGVMSISAVGPSKRKAYYSNYGTEQTTVAAPGGDRRDPAIATPGNLILSPYPESVARANEEIDENGEPTIATLLRECRGEEAARRCAYYAWFQGTSMAAPHASGVVALAVAEYGRRDRRHGGLTLDPDRAERILRRGATDTACPTPRLFEYPDPDLPPEYNAYCEGDADLNGFYGDGIVSATGILRAQE